MTDRLTTPIAECSIGRDAEYTVKVATQRGWSDFSIYPNGTLEGKAPNGETDFVADYARMAKDAAFDLLAALEALLPLVDRFHDFCDTQTDCCSDPDAECPISMGEWVERADRNAVEHARKALVAAKGEIDASN